MLDDVNETRPGHGWHHLPTGPERIGAAGAVPISAASALSSVGVSGLAASLYPCNRPQERMAVNESLAAIQDFSRKRA